MIVVIQRVIRSGVEIEGRIYSEIGKGLMVLLGITKGDSETEAVFLAKKIIELRIFPDENDKMNLSLKDTGGEVLVISQFTLCSDNGKSGNRPSFALAESPEKAKALFEFFIKELKQNYSPEKVQTGVFAAKMTVNIINDGPVTIILEKKNYNEK